jgi:speckle-type POZ protein
MNAEYPAGFGPCLEKYFNNKSLSDAVIRCQGREFAIHRLALCSHSEYFAKQLDGPWKESCERATEIVDFDVRIVEAMIYFVYHLNYDIPDGSSAMLFNAKMYQIGDKYAMSMLKTYAKKEFSTSMEEGWEESDFPDAISLVYTSTPCSDRGLRNIAVLTSLDHLDILIDRDEFKTELASNADFAIDLIQFQGKASRDQRRYTCNKCRVTGDIERPHNVVDFWGRAVYCPWCGKRASS